MISTATKVACALVLVLHLGSIPASARSVPEEVPSTPGEASSSVTNAAPPAVPASPPAVRYRELISDIELPPVAGFTTDFSRTVIRASEMAYGGPPKDGIPAVDRPVLTDPDEADEWLAENEPVFVVSADGATHIYPVQILTYHEIVNDVVGSTPLSVTYCPLCNSGLAFRRAFDGQVLDFGTTGLLRYSNLIMYDRQTESWWQQATGEGLAGQYAGYRLELHPVLMLPWREARDRFPGARVLSRDTGNLRPYSTNPYRGYDSAYQPYLFSGPIPEGPLAPMDRVIDVVVGSESLAVPYSVLEEHGVFQRELGGTPVVVFWEPGTASALDTTVIADGRDVGSANAFSAIVDGRTLSFEHRDDQIRDVETGSTWGISGIALAGELRGARLQPLLGVQHFWFSYSAFASDGRWSPAE